MRRTQHGNAYVRTYGIKCFIFFLFFVIVRETSAYTYGSIGFRDKSGLNTRQVDCVTAVPLSLLV